MVERTQDESPIAGFISPPRWYDPSSAEFSSVCGEKVRTQQTILPLFDFNFDDLKNIANTVPEMLSAARTLGDAGCQVIANTGTPFAWAGLESEVDVRARCDLLANAAGVPAVMAGTAIIDGLRALQANRVAIATPYYTQVWRERWVSFVEACGFDVLLAQSMDQQGILPMTVSIEDHGWATSPQLVTTAVEKIAHDAPEAEAVVITGAGARTLAIIDELEHRTGLSVLASDTALYWAIARELEVPLKAGVLGALTAAGSSAG